MKVLVIGSMAAGTSVTAKARRNREDMELLYTRKILISVTMAYLTK